MADTLARLAVQIEAETADFDRGMSRVRSALGDIGGTFGNFATSAARAGAMATAAIGGGLAAGLTGAAVAGLSFNNTLQQTEARMFAFLGDGEAVADTLAMIRERAAQTPFAFNDMADAAAALIPAARMSGQELEGLIETAEVLAASNPMEGLAGASFALREAISGDMTSIIERFNLSRVRLNELKEQGVPALDAVRIHMEELGLSTDLVTNLAATAEGRWGTFKDTLQGLAATATQPLFEGLSEGLGRVNEILASEGVQQRLSEIATIIGEKLGAAFSWLVDVGIPSVINAFNLLRTGDFTGGIFGMFEDDERIARIFAFRDALLNAFQLIKDAFTTFQQAVAGDWVDSSLVHPFHRVIGVIGQVVAAFQEGGLQAAIATLLPYIQQAFQSVIAYVQGQLPTLIAAFQSWGQAAWQWIQAAIPPLLAQAQALGQQLLAWVSAQAAPLLERFTVWKDAFIAWVVPATTEFLNQWPGMLTRFLDWITTAAGPILTRLGEWTVSFVTWAISMIPEFVTALAAIAAAVTKWIVDTAIVLGRFMLTSWLPALSRWIGEDLQPAMNTAFIELGAEIRTWLGNIASSAAAKAREIGTAIKDGVLNGLGGLMDAAFNALRDALLGAIERAKAAIFADSPSKLAADELGAPIAQGIAQGITDNSTDIAFALMEALGHVIGETQHWLDKVKFFGGIADAIAARLKEAVAELMPAVLREAGRMGSLFGAFSNMAGAAIKFAIDPRVALLSNTIDEIDTQLASMQEGGIDVAEMGEFYRLESERARLVEERAYWEERIAEIEEKRAKMAFLQQQVDFIRLLASHGLNARDILGDMELGLDADANQWLDAMGRGMDAIIQQMNEGLTDPTFMDDLTTAVQEQIRLQEELLKLEQARADLALLQMQFDLMKLLAEHGIPLDLLSRIPGFGNLGVDLDAFLRAMVEVMRLINLNQLTPLPPPPPPPPVQAANVMSAFDWADNGGGVVGVPWGQNHLTIYTTQVDIPMEFEIMRAGAVT